MARDPGFKDKEQFLRRWFDDPQTFPDEFKSWLVPFISQHPNFQIEQSSLPKGIPFGSIEAHHGTSPPDRPSDGDLWIYHGTGFYWSFVYDQSEAAYKWKFVGGASWGVQNLAGVNSTTNGWAFPAGSPTITLPREGDYEYQWNARGITSASSGVTLLGAGVSVNSTTVPTILSSAHSAGSNDHVDNAGSGFISAQAANAVVRLLLFQNTVSSTLHDQLSLMVKPIRVA